MTARVGLLLCLLILATPASTAVLTVSDLILSCAENLPNGRGLCDLSRQKITQTLAAVLIPRGVTARLGPVAHTVTGTVQVDCGAILEGVAWGTASEGTELHAADGLEGPMVLAQCREGPQEWWHAGMVQDLRIIGNRDRRKTDADCLFVDSLAETSLIENVYVRDCPGSGVRVHDNSAGTGHLRNVVAFNSAKYGFHFSDNKGAGIVCIGCGGDGNDLYTFAITGLGRTAFAFLGAKSENNGRKGEVDAVFFVDSPHHKALHISAGQFTCGVGGCKDLIRKTAQGSEQLYVSIFGAHLYGYAHVLTDASTGTLVPHTGTFIGRYQYP